MERERERKYFEEEKRLMEVGRKKLMLINYSLMTCHLFSFLSVEKKSSKLSFNVHTNPNQFKQVLDRYMSDQ